MNTLPLYKLWGTLKLGVGRVGMESGFSRNPFSVGMTVVVAPGLADHAVNERLPGTDDLTSL